MPSERFFERAGALIAMALGLAALLLSRELPRMEGGYPGPALFPSLLGLGLLGSGLALLWQGRRAKALPPAGQGPVVLMVLGLGLAPWLLAHLGLVATAALSSFLGGLLLRLGLRTALLTGGAVALFVHLVFQRLLGV